MMVSSEHDIEKNYWDEQNEASCGSRCCTEFCLHPYTILEANGRIIDVQKSFAFQPWYLIVILKIMAFGITTDCLVRDVLFYNGKELYFYMAYSENWCLALSLFYFIVSTFTSFWSLPKQPVPGEEGVQFHVGLAWFLYPIAVIASGVNAFVYWFFIYGNEEYGALSEFDYFAIVKNGGILLLLLVEGQVLNRIPIRWSHLIWSELVLCAYIGWTFIHDMFTEIGNPEIVSDSSTNSHEPIYGFLNWSASDNSLQIVVQCIIALTGVAPAVFVVLYCISWPCRRYLPAPNGDMTDDDSFGHRSSLKVRAKKEQKKKGRSKYSSGIEAV
mmetsp:Transcript_9243/g.14215  ORF Transcript_9243/g.14215 Transcript_9243/m.14215 type:complete len:328 (+) Transcript_9243:51-1034(+)